jgi:hypothetical protein
MVRLRRFVTFVRLAGFVSCHHASVLEHDLEEYAYVLIIGLLSLGI